ncbi:anti-sigma factor domain-containing protein [Chitinophaga sp. CF418]|uniref:anti-sigma factor n=1 Tax=Chitinophaga sp. CF418 TaxID=1855287 RepID=UPI00091BF3D2|nr:anti-sigma factor [Chitinophaga sp. CF418]SHN77529.1 Anti-sigma-K factor rskA [Chitinophaga sp. CF418]
MDVQRYISSGLIENHVTGLLSESESREVLGAIQQHPEVKAAAEALQVDMERYIQLWAAKPPAGIKRQIMDRLHKNEADDPIAAETETFTAATNENTFSEDTDAGLGLNLSQLQIWQYSAAAAIALLLGSVVMNVVSYGNASGYKQQVSSLQAEQASLLAEKDALKEQLDFTQKENGVMKDPSFKWIRMPGVGKHTGVVATICWNPQSKETFILAQALPEPPADKQYQLWAIVNGKPIDAGVFELGSKAHTVQKVKAVDNAQVFAVTLEKKGGSPSPTLEQMFVAGKVAG